MFRISPAPYCVHSLDPTKDQVFRCEATTHAYAELRLDITAFDVIKRTPCGVKIRRGFVSERFVNLKAKKQYASETILEAVKQFKHREGHQVLRLENQLKTARKGLELAENALKQGSTQDAGN